MAGGLIPSLPKSPAWRAAIGATLVTLVALAAYFLAPSSGIFKPPNFWDWIASGGLLLLLPGAWLAIPYARIFFPNSAHNVDEYPVQFVLGAWLVYFVVFFLVFRVLERRRSHGSP